MQKYFNSRYPIVEAAMNQVSDLPLALACWEAGITPSLVVSEFVQFEATKKNYDQVNSLLKEFRHAAGTSDLVFSVGVEHFFDQTLMRILKEHQVSHLEIYAINNPRDTLNDWERIKLKLGNNYTTVMNGVLKYVAPMKVMHRSRTPKITPFDFAYCLKGSDSAGSSGDAYTTWGLFREQRKLTPNAVIIPYGGVGTAEQVCNYINLGATAVGVGTLFAASQESNLSSAAKQAMIAAPGVTQIPDTKQNALILGNLDTVLADKIAEGDWNRERSLATGLHGNGTEGHIYAGAGVSYVTEIRSVKEIVEYLTSRL
jgi:NAD(P)H-dependent flavin oxidoreductase YrpB (nitropropane dioxygenase family)